MIKKILMGIVGLAVLVLAVFLVIAWESSVDPVDPPASDQFSQQQIDRGEVISGLGNCQTCHTTDPEQPYAGGLAMPTPFGTIYTTNITPDPETGIGQWSQEAFARAMREGVDRSGSHLFPAFPYTHFTKMTDEDVADLYAYVMTREPIRTEAPENTLEFPFNIRMLQAGWKLLFFDEGRYQAEDSMSDEWNRGAYLAEGLGHCSACHSPRNQFGAEDKGQAWEGTVVNGWYAPALNESNLSPVDWTTDDAHAYLREGASPFHGVAIGSMADVVHAGLGKAPDEDVRGLAVWLSDLAGAADGEQAGSQATAAIKSAQAQLGPDPNMSQGERIYAYACASCHYNDPASPNAMRPDMSLNSAVTAPDPVNLIRATLHGVSQEDGIPQVMMPGFASALSDQEIASLLGFLRETHTDQPAWDNLEQTIRDHREQ
ncbi:cytochrome c [Marinobacter zhanjiangensis]|uniref:Cytochrome c n=1 Tax=Marinobacter zhanjiangensis TaxID=578215 RepID=A0ABQ3B219_9GAMM|nr:cytochrome c [Marinobacter zhanjiangensis]GGY71059.1 cytochrome c [Marinobacter zhanjiangensis]